MIFLLLFFTSVLLILYIIPVADLSIFWAIIHNILSVPPLRHHRWAPSLVQDQTQDLSSKRQDFKMLARRSWKVAPCEILTHDRIPTPEHWQSPMQFVLYPCLDAATAPDSLPSNLFSLGCSLSNYMLQLIQLSHQFTLLTINLTLGL